MPRFGEIQVLAPAPRDSERLRLYDNLLADVAPLRSDGRRVLRPSRRGLLRLGGGLIAVAAQPACDADDVEAALGVIIFIANVAIHIAAAVEGEILLTNYYDRPINLEGLFSLFSTEHEVPVDTTEPSDWSIPPGDTVLPFGDLYAMNPGPHFVEMLLGGSAHESELFSIEA